MAKIGVGVLGAGIMSEYLLRTLLHQPGQWASSAKCRGVLPKIPYLFEELTHDMPRNRLVGAAPEATRDKSPIAMNFTHNILQSQDRPSKINGLSCG